MKDLDLLRAVLEADDELEDERGLSQREREAFASMRKQCEWRDLTPEQKAWVEAAAERLGVIEARPAANIFSTMPTEKQREHRAMVRTQLPWEDGRAERPLKPPPRRGSP